MLFDNLATIIQTLKTNSIYYNKESVPTFKGNDFRSNLLFLLQIMKCVTEIVVHEDILIHEDIKLKVFFSLLLNYILLYIDGKIECSDNVFFLSKTHVLTSAQFDWSRLIFLILITSVLTDDFCSC